MQLCSSPQGPPASTRGALTVVVAVLTAVILFAGSALPAWAADSMTLTFIRHGQSTANAAGVTDTSTPGPNLTLEGELQAEAVAQLLGGNNYTEIYASTMVRTQQTGSPMATLLGLPINPPLPGLRELEAGIFEGTPEILGGIATTLFGIQWIFGNRLARIPGSMDGYEFERRMNEAVQTIYDTRDLNDPNSVAFAHLGSIMFWTAMNVKNPDLLVMVTHPLPNTGYVVITGNPEDGWTLTNWNGIEIAPEPTFAMKLFIDARTLILTNSDSIHNIELAVLSLNPGNIASAVIDGAINSALSPFVFVGSVARDIFGLVGVNPAAPSQAVPSAPAAEVVPDAVSSIPVQDEKSGAVAAADAPIESDTVEPVAVDPEPVPDEPITESQRDSGPTDLTDGNATRPGKLAAVSASGDEDGAGARRSSDRPTGSTRPADDNVRPTAPDARRPGNDNGVDSGPAVDSGSATGSDTAGSGDDGSTGTQQNAA